MSRALAAAAAVYWPHLLEEALTGMHDDPLLDPVLSPLASLSSRHAGYLVFQVGFALALAALWLVSRGGAAARVVVVGLGFALVCESHHLIRALMSLHANSGLLTSLPMPWVGAWMVLGAIRSSSGGAKLEGVRT